MGAHNLRKISDGSGIGSDVASRSSGKERGTETGLDYFGARYYGSNGPTLSLREKDGALRGTP